MELAQSLTGKQKFQRRNNRKQGGESAMTQTWRGNRFSWWVILLPWRGSASAGSLQGGVSKLLCIELLSLDTTNPYFAIMVLERGSKEFEPKGPSYVLTSPKFSGMLVLRIQHIDPYFEQFFIYSVMFSVDRNFYMNINVTFSHILLYCLSSEVPP